MQFTITVLKSINMSSKSTQLRNIWKVKDPENFAQFLEKQRVRAKARRDAKKVRWENEPHTRSMIAEKEKENQQARRVKFGKIGCLFFCEELSGKK